MTIQDATAETARAEVGAWLRKTLPDEWLERVDEERSPGPLALYGGFDVDAWVRSLFATRYVTAPWPRELGGLGWDVDSTAAAYAELSRFEVPLPLYVSPLLMIGGAILTWGTDAQRQRFLPRMASGEELWCQLFSEPSAGSDLASLRTRAERDGDSWIINGQKVWNTFAHKASWGMLLARSDPESPRHNGITCFIIDMRSRGIDVRPLRQMTGESSFTEVFLDDVRVPDEQRIGPVNGGWVITLSMLQEERAILSSQRVGGIDVFRLLDRHRGTTNPLTRQRLADAYVRQRVNRLMPWRGYGDGTEAQVTKLLQTEANRDLQELALDLEGPHGLGQADGDFWRQEISYGFLRSRANTIAGGTSEIMRNVIGERILGLPREPRGDT